jgi:hypothetical protein
MMKAPQLHRPTPKAGAHLTHLLARYSSQEQERRRTSWKALVQRKAR